MTDDLRALDAEIAEARGWRTETAMGCSRWFAPDADELDRLGIIVLADNRVPPPFSSSWALAGPLLESLRDEMPSLLCHVTGPETAVHACYGRDFYAEAPTACEAIARAWLAWHRSKA